MRQMLRKAVVVGALIVGVGGLFQDHLMLPRWISNRKQSLNCM